MKNKKAAMEMSVGTIVTIVLLMTVLILGLVLVRTIFTSSVENIKGIDQAVKGEIKKLFSEDSARKIVVYPETRRIIIQKGSDDSGFAFAIRNTEEDKKTFSYEINAVETSCPDSMRLDAADELISLGKERNNIEIPSSSIMDNEIFVRFRIPETAPGCEVRYQIQVFEGSKSNPYISPVDVDLVIKAK